jgi:hypothetical protein
MKSVLVVLALVLAGSLASAQESYTFSVGGTTTNRASVLGQLELGRVQQNTDVCTRASLPSDCTQAQACVALGVTGGASCTAADAIAAQARIYPASLAGRESFVANELVRRYVETFLGRAKAEEANAFKTWCVSASQAQRDPICTAAGLPAGCYPCP